MVLCFSLTECNTFNALVIQLDVDLASIIENLIMSNILVPKNRRAHALNFMSSIHCQLSVDSLIHLLREFQDGS
jgi:hypothetical protein